MSLAFIVANVSAADTVALVALLVCLTAALVLVFLAIFAPRRYAPAPVVASAVASAVTPSDVQEAQQLAALVTHALELKPAARMRQYVEQLQATWPEYDWRYDAARHAIVVAAGAVSAVA